MTAEIEELYQQAYNLFGRGQRRGDGCATMTDPTDVVQRARQALDKEEQG